MFGSPSSKCIRTSQESEKPIPITLPSHDARPIYSQSNAITPPRLLNIPHLPPRHLQPHAPTPTSTTHILNLLPLPNPERFPLTLAANPPLRLKFDTRVPTPNLTLNRTSVILRFESRRRLAVESGLSACRCDDIFPQVSARGGGGDVCRDGGGAGGRVVLEPRVEEFEVVPDFAGLVVAAVGFAFEDGYVGL